MRHQTVFTNWIVTGAVFLGSQLAYTATTLTVEPFASSHVSTKVSSGFLERGILVFERGGGMDGGGGDVVILPHKGDDRVVLADSWVAKALTKDRKENGPVHSAWSQSIYNELQRAADLFVAFGGKSDGSGQSFMSRSDFINRYVLNPSIRYVLVNKIPDRPECRNRMRYRALPKGAVILQGACTLGDVTWLREDLFAKQRVRDQALLLVHEGLRRLPVAPADSVLAGITNGLQAALDALNSQLLGERKSLTSEETESLQVLRDSIVKARLNDPEETNTSTDFSSYSIFPYGGGLVAPGKSVPRGVFIGIGVIVRAEEKLKAGTEYMTTRDVARDQGLSPLSRSWTAISVIDKCLRTTTGKDEKIYSLSGFGARALRKMHESCVNSALESAGFQAVTLPRDAFAEMTRECGYFRADQADEAQECVRKSELSYYCQEVASHIQLKPMAD